MKKSILITAGIGAIVFGSVTAYQMLVKPQAENQIELILAEIQSVVEARGDGSEFTYGDVSVEGLSAVIPSLHYKDGKSGMVSDIEVAKISATNGHIHSAELTNWATQFSDDEEGMEFSSNAATTTIKNLEFPAEVTDQLLLGDITFEQIKTEDVTFNFTQDEISVLATLDESEMLGKSRDLIASTITKNMVMTIAPADVVFTMPEFASENTHVPAELNFMATPEDIMPHYAKFFSENTSVNADITYQDNEIGTLSYSVSDMKAGDHGFIVSGSSEMEMTATASREQLLEWMKLAAENSENPENFNEAEVTAFLEVLDVEQFEIGLIGGGTLSENGDMAANITYDLGELGKLDIEADLSNYDAEKVNAILSDPTKEPSDADMMAAFGEIGIRSADITYADGKLADFLLELNPKMPRAQMVMMSQLILPSMLKTEPTLAEPLTEAVVNFINGAEKFEIHAAPDAPVKINDIVKAVMTQQQVAPLFNVTVSGQ